MKAGRMAEWTAGKTIALHTCSACKRGGMTLDGIMRHTCAVEGGPGVGNLRPGDQHSSCPDCGRDTGAFLGRSFCVCTDAGGRNPLGQKGSQPSTCGHDVRTQNIGEFLHFSGREVAETATEHPFHATKRTKGNEMKQGKESVFKVIRTGMAAPKSLKPHPDAIVPISQEAKETLNHQLNLHGIRDAIWVNERNQIISGVNRWEWATENDVAEVPVQVVECDDVRTLVIDHQARRNSSLGQLAILELERHPKEVADWYRIGQAQTVGVSLVDAAKRAGVVGSAAYVEKLSEKYNHRALAELLGINEKMASAAVALVAHCHLKLRPYLDVKHPKRKAGDPLDPNDKVDAAVIQVLENTRNRILSGEAGLQNWRVVSSGLSQEVGGKNPERWNKVAERAIKSLGNVLTAKIWNGLTGTQKDKVVEDTAAVVEQLVKTDPAYAQRILDRVQGSLA